METTVGQRPADHASFLIQSTSISYIDDNIMQHDRETKEQQLQFLLVLSQTTSQFFVVAGGCHRAVTGSLVNIFKLLNLNVIYERVYAKRRRGGTIERNQRSVRLRPEQTCFQSLVAIN